MAADMSLLADITDLLRARALEIPGVEDTLGRPLRTMDPHGCVGVFPGDWAPMDYEITGGATEPSIQRYTYNIQYVSKGTDEQEISALHAETSRRIRTMLYRDTDLRVALVALSETLDGVREQAKRLGVVRQRFFSNSAGGTFFFLSHIDMWVETNA